MTKQKSDFNSTLAGIIPGLIVPVIASYLFFISRNFTVTYQEFMKYTIDSGLFSKVLSLSLVANLGVFFIFIWTNRYKSARGVILATIIYGIIIILLKV